MAVVLEIEVSEPFDCHGWEQSSCDQAQVDRGLNEVYKLGVRSMLLLNKFDNPLVGVRFDSGPVGVLINGGNKVSAGSYWSAHTCTGKLTDNENLPARPPDRRGAQWAAHERRAHRRERAHVPAGAALQHARPDDSRQARGGADDGQAHDREPGPHEPGRGRRDALAARGAQVLGRHLAAWLDGSWQLAAAVEARRGRVPGPLRRGGVRQGVEDLPPAADPVRVRMGLRRRPRRTLAPAGRKLGREGLQVPVQELRRQGDLHPPEDRHADLRLRQGRRRPVRPVRRLVQRPEATRRRGPAEGHVGRRRGLPRDVGARRRRPDALVRATPTTRSRRRDAVRCGSAAAGSRCSARPASRSSARAPGAGA